MKKAWLLGLSVLVLGGIFAAGNLLGTPSPDGLDQAQKHITDKSYKLALDYLDKAVKSETGQRLQKASRLRAIAMCNLRDKNGAAYAQEIIAKYPQLKTDAQLHQAIAVSHNLSLDPLKSYHAYIKAAQLFTQDKKDENAFWCYLSAVELLAGRYNQIFIEGEFKTWVQRRDLAIQQAFKFSGVCERLNISDRQKAEVIFKAGAFGLTVNPWEDVEKAIDFLLTIPQKYKQTPHSPAAQLLCGNTYERFNKFPQAIKMYSLVSVDYPLSPEAKGAADQIERIRDPQLSVNIIAPVLPGRKAQINWSLRNLKKVHFSANRIRLDELANLERIGHDNDWYQKLPQESPPVKTWEFETPDDGTHLYYNSSPEGENKNTVTCPVDEEGMYLITAQGRNPSGKKAVATCLLYVSNIASISKADSQRVVVYCGGVEGGKPVSGAKVLLFAKTRSEDDFLGRAIIKNTDDTGLCVIDAELKKIENYHWNLKLIIIKGGSAAVIERMPVPYRQSSDELNREIKGYGFTERPVYRPGHTVNFKQIFRFTESGEYVNSPDLKLNLKIYDPKREVVYQRDFVTDKFGAVEGSFKLSEKAKLGEYYFEITPDNSGERKHFGYSPGNRFRVEEYRKPEFEVNVSSDAGDYRVGDEVEVEIFAKYLFGQPVVSSEINYEIRKQSFWMRDPWPIPYQWYREMYFPRWPGWYRHLDEHVVSGKVTTDENGKAYVKIKADPFKGHETQDIKFIVDVTASDSSRRVIRGSGQVVVTHAPFAVFAKPAWAVNSPGDQVKVDVTAKDPNGKPVSGKFTAEAWTLKRVEKDGKATLEPDTRIYTGTLETSVSGRADMRFAPDVSGHIRVIITEDKPDKPVTGECTFWVADKNERFKHYAYGDLELVVSQDQLEIGDTLKILLNTRHDGYVLLTQEADVLLHHQLVKVSAGTNSIELPIAKKHCPNFELQAVMINDSKIIRDSAKIIVPPTNRFLDVDVTLEKVDKNGGAGNTYQPREKFNINVKLTDKHTGKPVAGQMTLMLVDSAVYYIQPEYRQAIEKDFYGSIRHNGVATLDNFQQQYPHLLRARANEYGRIAGGMPMAAKSMSTLEAKSDDSVRTEALDGEMAQQSLAQPVVRKEFRDTVLWAGSVETGADGTAQLSVTLPDQLGRFALHAIAFDGDTRVGEASRDIISTKRIIARLQTPRFFTEGDGSYITVIAHNYYDAPHKACVNLDPSRLVKVKGVFVDGVWRKFEDGIKPIAIEIPAGGEVRLDYDADIIEPGEVKLLASVKTAVESDAIELEKQVLAWGMMRLDPFGGELSDKRQREVTWNIEVPDKIRPHSQSFTVQVNPSLISVVLESLPYLAQYPYGCVEQTTSRFVPLVQVRKSLQNAGIKLSDIKKMIEASAHSDPKLKDYYKLLQSKMQRNPVWDDDEIDSMIAKGVARLAELQHSDGSWGWWKQGDQDGYMTAYVVSSLAIARDCDVKLPGQMLERGVKWLVNQAGTAPKIQADSPWWYRRLNDDNARAYMLYAIAAADKGNLDNKSLRGEITRLYETRDKLSDYGRALLAMVLYDAGMKPQARVVIDNLDNTAVFNEKLRTVQWGKKYGWWHWYHGGSETTAWVLRAMLKVDSENKNIPGAVRWLVTNRRNLYWYNTKATAMVSAALLQYAQHTGEFECDQTYEVLFDGNIIKKIRITKDNLFTFDNSVIIQAEQLGGGKHTITVKQQGIGNLYCDGYLRYFDLADKIEESANRVHVSRKYFKLTQEEFTNTRRIWKDGKYVGEQFSDTRYKRDEISFGQEITTGQLIEVELDITADENLEYMIFEDPKPAGCEPYRLTSGGQYGGFYSHMEVRDTMTVFFADWVRTGNHKVTYKLVCEQPGTFRIIPTNSEAMYAPNVKANSQSGLMTITR